MTEKEPAGSLQGRISELWLEEFGRLTNSVLHGLRNGLQGVGINLEVIRSRTDHGSAAPVDLRTFAMNASRQFEDVSAQVEALAFLSKEIPGQADIGGTVRAVSLLLNAGGAARVSLAEAPIQAKAALDAHAARLILVHAIVAATKAGEKISCCVRGPVPAAVELIFRQDARIQLSSDVLEAAAALHVHFAEKPGQLTVTFPTTLISDTDLV